MHMTVVKAGICRGSFQINNLCILAFVRTYIESSHNPISDKEIAHFRIGIYVDCPIDE